jgi:hypothetical protein
MMAFSMQGAGPMPHWFTIVILCVFLIGVIRMIMLYKLGGMPGAIAAARGHPQAGIITLAVTKMMQLRLTHHRRWIECHD